MESIAKFTSVLSDVATVLGVAGLWFTLLALRGARKSFHHAVITSCTSRFQQLSPKLAQDSLTPETVQLYLELCNEEAFYFENGFLPQAIVDEWLDGMLSFFYFARPDGSLFHPLKLSQPQPDLSPFLAVSQRKLLDNYPRLKNAFRINQEEEEAILKVQKRFGDEAVRAQMVLTVLDNIKSYQRQPFLQHLRRTRTKF